MQRTTLLAALVLSTFLLAGCTAIEVRHDIRRTGVSDINITARSEQEQAIRAFKTVMNSSPLALEHAQLYRKEDRITYAFTNVKPQVANITRTMPTTDIGINKQLDFPYYRINITIERDETPPTPFLWDTPLTGIPGTPRLRYRLDAFGTITATNGKQVGDAVVLFDLTEPGTQYVTVTDPFYRIWLHNAVPANACSPRWQCSDWTYCTNFTQTRDCHMKNSCQNYMYRPRQKRPCQTPVIDAVSLNGTYNNHRFSVAISGGRGTVVLTNSSGTVLGTASLAKEENRVSIPVASTDLIHGGTYTASLNWNNRVQAQRSVTYTGALFTLQNTDLWYNVTGTGHLMIRNISSNVANEGDTSAPYRLYYRIGNGAFKSLENRTDPLEPGNADPVTRPVSVQAEPGNYNITLRLDSNSRTKTMKSTIATINYPKISIQNISIRYTYNSAKNRINVTRITSKLYNADTFTALVEPEYKIGNEDWRSFSNPSIRLTQQTSHTVRASQVGSFAPGTYNIHVRIRAPGTIVSSQTRTVDMTASSAD